MNEQNTDLSKWKTTKLIFNGHEHTLFGVITVGRSGPLIDVPVSEVEYEPIKLGKDELPQFTPATADVDDLELIVYQHKNRYLILTGRHQYFQATRNNQGTVKARLVSKPALKKARILPAPSEAPARVFAAPAPTYDRNRTPYSDRRYGNGR